MSEASPRHDETLPFVQRIDHVCHCFEAAWKGGQRPQVEEYLGDTPEPERGPLWRS